MNNKSISFILDGKKITANVNDTIFEAARSVGINLPHLCYLPKPGYRPDGNCRICMVEVENERILTPSCLRLVSPNMNVKTNSQRAVTARKAVMELLLADQNEREKSHDDEALLWQMADKIGIHTSRYPSRKNKPLCDDSHIAMSVNLEDCIHCNLCVRACREVQVNDVIGLAHRGAKSKIIFDFDDEMGKSTCVGCGECVQACPTGALMESSRLDLSGAIKHKADRKVDSLCPYCGVGCQLSFHIKEDKLLYVEGRDGPSNNNRLCVKGRFGFDYVHHPERLQRPLIRKNNVPKNPEERLDPRNPYTHFRDASWDEALDFAASKLASIKKQNGNFALAGFGSAKGSNEEAYIFQKLVRTGFGSNNVDHCTRLCHASSVAALMENIGSGAVTAPVAEVKNAELAMVIGARPTENHPVAATFIKNAAKKGMKLIVVDPRYNQLSKYATITINHEAGSDVAFLNAVINEIVAKGLVNRQYIEKYTSGYQDLKQYIKDFTPEEMSPICGIDAKTIRKTAHLFANAKNAMIFWGMGISQHIHGTDNARCLITLALITGNVGKSGSGLHPLRGQNNVQGASDVGLIPMVYPDYQNVENPSIREYFEDFWGTKLDPKKGLTVVEIMNEIYDRKIKALYVMGENPAMSDPNLSHARAAMAKLEHLIVQDIFLTETAYMADVILPASAFPEKEGSFTNTDRRVQIARKALPLPYDCRQDWWIIQEIARRMGLEWNYAGPPEIYEELRRCMPSLKGISWKRLEREDAVVYPCESEDKDGEEIIFADGFPTPDGRGKLTPVNIVEAAETTDGEYPFILTTGRLLEHWHTGAMTKRAQVLQEIEPQPTIHLSPDDIKDYDINLSQHIKLKSRRGEIKAQPREDRNIPPGTVFMPFCFEKAAINLLTNDALDPFGKIPEFKYCAVKIQQDKI